MQLKNRIGLGFASFLACTMLASAQGTVWLVDGDDGDDMNSGTTTWTQALATIEEALNQADEGDTILVAEEVYGPATNPSSNPIAMIDGVDILGGFVGYPSGSTDPDIPDGRFSKTVIKGATNTRCCVADGTSNAKLRGFVVRLGEAVDGGGMYCENTTNLDIELVRFHNNEASDHGGGLYLHDLNRDIEIDRTTFDGNWAPEGAGLYVKGPGGTQVLLGNCHFFDNGNVNGPSTTAGGAIYFGPETIVDSSNCLIENNEAVLGGGIYIQVDAGSNAPDKHHHRNLTISKNKSIPGGGAGAGVHMTNSASNTQDAFVKFTNTIVWGNLVGDDVFKEAGGMPLTLDYCDYGTVTGGVTITNSISAAPLFLNASTGNFRLKSTSPCVETGLTGIMGEGADIVDLNDDGNPTELLPFDLDLLPRRIDVIGVPGAGTDMGAFERGGGPIIEL